MSFDMSQFYQVFFEEAGEHLDSMESMLLDLDLEEPDTEQLNAIFRAAHSIKGSAGTFGFTDMAELTHILENLLDPIRKGELSINEQMIDAFLVARDVLGGQLATHRDGAASDPAAVSAIEARLKLLTHELATGAVSERPIAKAVVHPPSVDKPIAGTELSISFVLDGASSTWSTSIENLTRELAEFGTVTITQHGNDQEPTWRLIVADATNADGIRDVIEFVACIGTVSVSDAVNTAAATVADTDDAFGFFSDEPAQAVDADDSFGLFEPLAAEDNSFGFFEPVATPSTDVVAEDESYGLFELPVAQQAIEPAPELSPPPSAERRGGKPANSVESTIRVGVDKVDQIMNMVGELVITQAMLVQSSENLDPVLFERLHNGLTQLERNTRDLQESVMSIRMLPIATVFNRFPRVVRDLSHKLGKQVELKMIGEGTELDRGLIERITDPLTHLIRNSLDHGIEMPEARRAVGKEPVGTITLKAYQRGGSVVIEVGDDGAGLNRERILAKARERGLPVHDGMSDSEVWNLIFEAGFSTAEQVTDVSGRGVGMDVVKRNISAMGGRVEIESITGIGTRMTVRLPLTLAILDGMSIAVGAETYILPLGYVIESLQATAGMIKSMGGTQGLLQVREEYLPIIPLHEALSIRNAEADFGRGIMVLLEADGQRAALFVDALLGQHQVVVKSLEVNYRKVNGISSATIMGDGRVAFILDVPALLNSTPGTAAVAA